MKCDPDKIEWQLLAIFRWLPLPERTCKVQLRCHLLVSIASKRTIRGHALRLKKKTKNGLNTYTILLTKRWITQHFFWIDVDIYIGWINSWDWIVLIVFSRWTNPRQSLLVKWEHHSWPIFCCMTGRPFLSSIHIYKFYQKEQFAVLLFGSQNYAFTIFFEIS